MTFQEAIAQLPAWVQIWMNVLVFAAFIAPLSLLIWKQTRITGLITALASVLGGIVMTLMYNNLGYVRLLGLPHIILWTPLVIYLISQARRQDMPNAPKWIIWFISAILIISLAFDYSDLIRYIFGERARMI